MSNSTTGKITIGHAWVIVCISQALGWVFLGLGAVLDPNRPAAIFFVLCAPVILVLYFGGTFLGTAVLAGQTFPGKRAMPLVIDLGLLPLVIPVALVLAAAVIALPVSSFASHWLSDLHSFLIGLEFGTFAWIAIIPFLPLIWPVIHRNRLAKQGTENSHRLAVSPLPLVLGYVGATVLTTVFQPSLVFVIVFAASWVAFLGAYRIILLPRVPRFVSRF
jgi:hypothetical protein